MRTSIASSLFIVIAAACSGDSPACAATAVTCPSVASVAVDPSTLTLLVGERSSLRAVVDARDGASSGVAWTTSNAAIATVSEEGLVTGVLPGQATITARSTFDRGKAGTARVTVTLVPVASVGVAAGGATSLKVHETLQCTATVYDAAGHALDGRAVTWSSSNATIATVANEGLVTALAEGSVQITATSGGHSGSVTLSVKPAAVASVAISPNRVMLAPGATMQLSVTAKDVTGAVLTGRTVTWTSSDVARALISAAGIVTAVLPGLSPVIIKATVENVSDSAQVTIQVLGPSVGSTDIFLPGTTTPVNRSAVTGTIDVAMRIDDADGSAGGLDVYLGGSLAGSHTFAAPPGTTPVVTTINTADYTLDAAAGTATVRWKNGAVPLRAVLRQKSGTSTEAPEIPITLANVDGFAATVTPPTASVLAADGARWYGGPSGAVAMTLVPVMYSEDAVTAVTWSLGGGPPVTVSAPPFRASLGTGTTPDYAGYASTPGRPDGITIVGSRVGAGAGPSAFVPGGAPAPMLVDYAPPTGGALVLPASGWVGSAFSFAAAYAAPTDGGVGLAAPRTIAYAYVGCGAGMLNPIPMASATGVDIPECTADPTGGANGPYMAIVAESDRLGNRRETASGRFGVDRTPPVASFAATSLADGAILASAPPSPAFRLVVNDAPSGVAAQPILQSLTRGGAGATAGACVIGSGSPGTAFVTAPTCGDAPSSALQVDLPAGAAGYYVYRWRAIDKAGNVSAPLTRTIAIDPATPTIGTIAMPAQVTAAAGGTFTTSFTDDAEGIEATFGLLYPAGGENIAVRYPFTTFGKRFDDVISASGAVAQSAPTPLPFVRRLEMVDPSSHGVRASSSGSFKATQATSIIWDVAATSAASQKSVAIPDAIVENGVAFTAFNAANPLGAVNAWEITPSLGGSAGPQSVVTTGLLAASAPFVRIDFYRQLAALGALCYYGSTTAAPTQTLGLFEMNWTYRAPTPVTRTCVPPGNQSAAAAGDVFIAVGVTAAGDGLATRLTTLVP